MVYLECAKAFDKVDHGVSYYIKLETSGHLGKLLVNFIADRSQDTRNCMGSITVHLINRIHCLNVVSLKDSQNNDYLYYRIIILYVCYFSLFVFLQYLSMAMYLF